MGTGRLIDRGLLGKAELFASLDPQQLDECWRAGRVVRVAERQTIVRQREDDGSLFVVLEGRLRAVASSNLAGESLLLSFIGPGEVFGEIALLDGGPRSASVVAHEPCVVLAFSRTTFLGLLARFPPLATRLLEMLARRVRGLSERAEDAIFTDTRRRLAKALLMLARRFGSTDPVLAHQTHIDLKVSQRDLAELIGASREMVNKILNEWTREGLIERPHARIVLRDEPRLASLIEGSPTSPEDDDA